MKERQITSILDAIKQNNTISLREHIGINFDATLSFGKWKDTWLHVAVRLKSSAVIELLIASGIGIYLVNQNQITALELAMLTNQQAIIDIFLHAEKFPADSILKSICENNKKQFS